jgi:collagenase-like PrtC family protease
MPHRRPEILAPAGDIDSLQAALANGADAAVHEQFGVTRGTMRVMGAQTAAP